MRKILSAIGDDRIHSSKLELAQHFNGDTDVKNVKSVFKKLNVGKDGCSMLELQWVPDSLKAIGQPENVMGCGAPHLHMFTTGCHKVGPKDIPFWGFSQFILGISGACWLVSWPASFATDLSMSVESLFDTCGAPEEGDLHQLLPEHCLPLPGDKEHGRLGPLRALLHAHPAPGPGARPHCGLDDPLHERQSHAQR